VHDPYEGFNRGVYRVNDAIDRTVLVPVAKGYRYVTPDFLELGIANFFSNIGDVTVLANNLLQGKFTQAASDTARIFVNTTAGIGGFFDAGTKVGLEKHNESFGQTLGHWGVGEGPFLMLPLLGPNNARSTDSSRTARSCQPNGGWLMTALQTSD
jgi:phospholipid-binding lipoprotein MlaA